MIGIQNQKELGVHILPSGDLTIMCRNIGDLLIVLGVFCYL
jgi:hypothetical protein